VNGADEGSSFGLWCFGAGNKAMSLFGLLNRCRTSMGQRLLAQWLKQPLLQIDAIGRIRRLGGSFSVSCSLFSACE
jgi:DNA mismatch repair ATPase MutS